MTAFEYEKHNSLKINTLDNVSRNVAGKMEVNSK